MRKTITPSNTEMIERLKNPVRAAWAFSHNVTYEIFLSPNHKKLASLDREISKIENMSTRDLVGPHFTDQNAEAIKQKNIEELRKQAVNPEDLLGDILQHKKRYNKVKKYFEDKVKELGLENPLLFFDDIALRIDIGYSPNEFDALFHDFYYGVFKEEIYDFSLFAKAGEVFKDVCLTEAYRSALDIEKNRLLEKARKEFQNPLLTKKIHNFSDSPTEKEIITKYLKNNHGFVIGEIHEHKSPKQFLIDNMPLLKSQGVTTLYMEHLLHEHHQALLDEYMKSSADAPIPKKLEIYLRYHDERRGLNDTATFTGIVKAAKQNGIRIVAIDSEASYQIVGSNIGDRQSLRIEKDRYSAMNISMLERVREHSDGGKYVAFVGSGHVANCLGVSGVSDLLGCPNIVIHDFENGYVKESFEKNAMYGTGEKSVNFDIWYHRAPGAKNDVANDRAVNKFFDEHPPKSGSFWYGKDKANISLEEIVRHALGENNKGFLSGYSGRTTKTALRDDYKVEFNKQFELLPIDEKVKQVCEKINNAPSKKLVASAEVQFGAKK